MRTIAATSVRNYNRLFPFRLILPKWIGCGLVLAALALNAFAQQAGQIVGIVRDSSGLAIPGAKVTGTEAGTNFSVTATTGSTGDYVLPNLRPTVYIITATATGFRSFRQTDVRLQANQSLTVNIVME